MQLRHFLAAAVAATVAITAPAVLAQPQEAEAPKLTIGDKAPKLENLIWHQGRIESFEPGKIYVLDFWATWCGPCIAAMPHMNEVAEKYKDKGVTVIGLAVFPNSRMMPVADFLEGRNERGEELKYLIAEDNPEATNEKAYMRAASQNGIPTVMIVDRSGQVAWIGHPMGGMDEALEEIIEGTYDLASAREEFLVQQEKNRKMMELQPKLQEAFGEENWERAFALFDEMAEFDLFQARLNQYVIATTYMKDKNRAKETGRKILGSELGEQSYAMNRLAWFIVDPRNPASKEDRDLDLAMEAATRAVRLTDSKEADSLDTLARVYFWKGNYKKAVELQTKAVELADDTMKGNLQTVLDEYKALADE